VGAILITGSAGFIGSHLLEMLLAESTEMVISLDKLTYAANIPFIEAIQLHDRHRLVVGDISNPEVVHALFKKYDIETVFHLAAESHVDNSIADPSAFVQTNLVGTFNLLDAARQKWMSAVGVLKPEFSRARFIHVSTDEVFGALGAEGHFSESSPYLPNSPYSASKAGSDHFARAYYKTYGFPSLITNCSNNFGPRQHQEKLIPTIVRNALSGNSIPIYGRGTNVRDWIYVKDHAKALLNVWRFGSLGGQYLIGGEYEMSNLDLAQLICQILDDQYPKGDGSDYANQITFVGDRPGHDFRYAIHSNFPEIIWKDYQRTSFSEGLQQTISYLKSSF